MKRYRVSLFFVLLLLVWLVFGSQIIEVVTTFLTRPEGLPAGAKLEGKLFYTQGFDGVWQIDLRTGTVSQWWQPPDSGLATGVAASPDGSQLAIAYAPPSEEGFQIGTTDLFLSPSDQPDLQPLLLRENRNESYRHPSWSSDGQWLYFSHQTPVLDDAGEVMGLQLTGERIESDGDTPTPEVILEGAEQLALSPDGQQIVYLQLDTRSYRQGLWVVNHEGTGKSEIVPAGTYRLMASPKFTPDGESVIFSASGAAESEATSADHDGGVQVAQAHGDPWNIWQISLDDGAITKLTQTPLDGPWVAWSTDGANMAILAAEGVFVIYEGRFYRLAEVASEGQIAWSR